MSDIQRNTASQDACKECRPCVTRVGTRPKAVVAHDTTVSGVLRMHCCRPRRALRGYGAYERGCTQALRRHGGLGGTRRCSVDSGSCPPQKRASIASGRGKTLPSAKRQGFWVENSPVGGCAALRAVHSRSMPEPCLPCLRGGFFPCQRITDALSFWKAVPISPWVFVARTLFLNT